MKEFDFVCIHTMSKELKSVECGYWTYNRRCMCLNSRYIFKPSHECECISVAINMLLLMCMLIA